MKLTIGYFYKNLLNLYGDTGNVEILNFRASARGIDVEVIPVEISTPLSSADLTKFNVIFMGGGPDSGQKQMYEDLVSNKGVFLKEYIENGGVGLYICGSYQLLGQFYKAADGTILKGLGIFNIHTEHFGTNKPRCIGNVVCNVTPTLANDHLYKNVSKDFGSSLVGFENHGGRTYLGDGSTPLARIVSGHGNNGEDGTEGIIYKNSIGSYLHGPVLARNPRLADYLIAKALGVTSLAPLDDSLIVSAHTASKKLKQ